MTTNGERAKKRRACHRPGEQDFREAPKTRHHEVVGHERRRQEDRVVVRRKRQSHRQSRDHIGTTPWIFSDPIEGGEGEHQQQPGWYIVL